MIGKEWGNCPRGNLFWFILIILLKWWNDEKSHPTYLLALRSNPVTQLEHERITHRNMNVFIINDSSMIFFSLPKMSATEQYIGSNRILTNRIRNEWTTIRQMTCLPFLVSTLQLLYPSSYRKHQLTITDVWYSASFLKSWNDQKIIE